MCRAMGPTYAWVFPHGGKPDGPAHHPESPFYKREKPRSNGGTVLEQRRGGSFAGVVRGEWDRPPRDLRSRCCYLPAALTKMRGTLESVQLLLNRVLTRPRKGRSWAA